MNLFNRVFNLDECSSTSQPSIYFNQHFNDTDNNSRLDSVNQHHYHNNHANGKISNNLSKLIVQLKNCHLIRDNKLIKDDLFIRNGVILNPEKLFFDEKATADMQIDCENLILAPGFIDVQLNGGFGKDFTDNTAENIQSDIDFVSGELLQYGVTSFCPTIISSHSSTYSKLIPNVHRSLDLGGKGAHVLGIHLEGPFISNDKPGCHDESTLQTFKNGIESIEKVYGLDIEKLKESVSIITLAPELDLNGDIIRYLKEKGFCVSIGHSSANLAIGEKAFENGARFITHLYNAMLPFHHRDPHLIGLLSNRNLVKQENIYYGIIADDIHTHPSAINISYKAHPTGLVLVTDSMAAMGLEDGKTHKLGNKMVDIVCDPVNKRLRSAYVQGTKTLCGSVATMDDCVKNLMNATGCSLVEAVNCATEHPAKLLNLYPRKGSLNYGADADFVIIDEQVNVKATFINGDLAWSEPNWSPLFNYKFIP
jgi:N-acetylglucosamine-6-phosphate deacetylase